MSGRDAIAWIVNSGELAQVRQEIADLEAQLASIKVQLKSARDAQRTTRDQRQRDQLKCKERELSNKQKQLKNSIRSKVNDLWDTTLRTVGQSWSAWNDLAAVVYQSLESLSEEPISPDEYRKLWMQHIRDTLGSRRQPPHLRQEVQRWRVERLLAASETPICNQAMLAQLPPGSFCLRFCFTLDEAFLSRDDQLLYIIENPVRKDCTFHLPAVSPAGWKGNLRWTAGKRWADKTAPAETMAEERFRLALLFGDETGEEEGTKLARYLDDRHPEAKDLYRQKLRRHFGIEDDEARLPHHAGRLEFYPTFFDRLDIEVINPHDRRLGTSARGPIYIESVPADTSSWFTLVYVPFDLVGWSLDEVKATLRGDLPLLAEALKEMFCSYGFSAKKSSGFGLAKTGPGSASGEWLVNLRVPEVQAAASASPRLVPLVHPVTDLLALPNVADALCNRLEEATR